MDFYILKELTLHSTRTHITENTVYETIGSNYPFFSHQTLMAFESQLSAFIFFNQKEHNLSFQLVIKRTSHFSLPRKLMSFADVRT